MRRTRLLVVLGLVATGLLAQAALPATAHAYEWKRSLKSGDTGKDVKALQTRLAGWFPKGSKTRFYIDGEFGDQTTTALMAFQNHYDLNADGQAGKATFDILESLTDPDGSTAHFDYVEFAQNKNPACSAKANAYAGTFLGGMVAPSRVKKNIKQMMWRLEAIRAKAGGKPIGINSGFRSTIYNDCIGGARASQHLYGTAADNRMAKVSNKRQRRIARRSQIQGIACYSNLSHNHFDTRVDNRDLEQQQAFWWPKRDEDKRDLDDRGSVCWGQATDKEDSDKTTARFTTSTVLGAIRALVPGAGAWIPSLDEIAAFQAAGEPEDLNGAD